jgi:hypothetical protein
MVDPQTFGWIRDASYSADVDARTGQSSLAKAASGRSHRISSNLRYNLSADNPGKSERWPQTALVE